jgi:hypothetical protein
MRGEAPASLEGTPGMGTRVSWVREPAAGVGSAVTGNQTLAETHVRGAGANGRDRKCGDRQPDPN